MGRYQVIVGEDVINTIEWDGVQPWTPPEGSIVVEDDEAGPGWKYVGGQFTPPPEPTPTPLSPAEVRLEAAVDQLRGGAPDVPDAELLEQVHASRRDSLRTKLKAPTPLTDGEIDELLWLP